MAILIEAGAAFKPDISSEQLWFGVAAGLVLAVFLWYLWNVIAGVREGYAVRKRIIYENHMNQMRREIKAEVMAELAPDEDSAGPDE